MSTETNNLKLFKYDKEADKEELVDIDKAFNENWDKIDKAVGKNKTDIETNQTDISNLKKQDISQNELIEQLQKRNTLLESQIPTGTVEGENITIKDSSNMPFKKFETSGNDYQETSEASSNILDPNRLTSGFINLETGALEGVNSTYPNSTYTPPIKLNTNDVLRIFNSPSAGQRLRIYNLDGTYNSYVNESYYTAETDCLVRVLFLDTINNNTSIKINNANSTYEEFTPDMPSIDYPSEVRACGDNVNLFDKDNANIVSLNANATKGNSGTYATATNQKHIYIECEPNTNYAIEKSNDISSVLGIYETSEIPKIGVNYYCHYFSSSNSDEVSIKTSETAKYLDIRINTNTLNEEQLSSILDSIKICKGTSTGGYSKCGQGSITVINSNKNKLKFNDSTVTSNGITTTVKDNTIKLNGTTTSGWFNMTPRIYHKIKAGTYMISKNFNYQFNIKMWYTDGTVADWVLGSNTMSNKWYVPKDVESYYTFLSSYGVANKVFNNEELEVQLEEGTTATEIVPHQSKEYIVPTQQPFYEGDTFVKVDGVRYEKHIIDEKILKNDTGILSIELQSINNYGIANFLVKYSNVDIYTQENVGLSNMLKTQLTTISNTSEEGILLQLKNDYIRINKDIASTVDEFKQLLDNLYEKGTPLKVYHVLKTPILIPCTEDQNAILDEIEQDENYKNITHIYSEDEISPTFNVEYYKDRETTEKNLEDRITALEELLSTTATSAMLLDNMQTDLESEV